MKVTITAKWGSQFQKESGEGALIAMLQGWQDFYGSKHRENELNVSMDDEEGEDV